MPEADKALSVLHGLLLTHKEEPNYDGIKAAYDAVHAAKAPEQ